MSIFMLYRTVPFPVLVVVTPPWLYAELIKTTTNIISYRPTRDHNIMTSTTIEKDEQPRHGLIRRLWRLHFLFGLTVLCIGMVCNGGRYVLHILIPNYYFMQSNLKLTNYSFLFVTIIESTFQQIPRRIDRN